jgi:hypothetical protein
MELSYAFFAHAAEFSPDGKLSVLSGDLDTLFSEVFPFTHPAIALVVKLLIRPEECPREYQFRAEIVDPHGEVIPPKISFPFTPNLGCYRPDDIVGMGLSIHLQGITFPVSGKYVLQMWVDDQPLGRPVTLHLAPESARI